MERRPVDLYAALADWAKIFVFIVLPLLLIGAFVETTITPRIVEIFFGK